MVLNQWEGRRHLGQGPNEPDRDWKLEFVGEQMAKSFI